MLGNVIEKMKIEGAEKDFIEAMGSLLDDEVAAAVVEYLK
jgi:hypothetical protein